MSFWSSLGPLLGKVGASVAAPFTGGASLAAIPAIDAIGAAAGAGSQAAASNRGTKLSALMDQDTMRMRAAGEQRTSESDALRKLIQARYISNGGAHFKPTTPYSYSFAPEAPGVKEHEAATLLENEMMKRLSNPMQLSDYSKQMNPGFWEKYGGMFGAGASAYGGLTRKTQSPVMYGMDTRED
jgi:hypothetical protein